MPAARWSRCTGGKSRRGCAKARRCTCICPVRIAACGTKRRSLSSKEIILCEALIDALTFWCAGFRHVTTSYGINGFTDEHRAAFKKYGTKKIYFAYDRDDAGEGAAQELAEELLAMGIDCYRVQFPKSMDANEYALKVTPAAKSLGILLNKAAWFGKGKRPIVTVSEPTLLVTNEESQPPTTGEHPNRQLKEKYPQPTQDAPTVETILPLAAESAEPIQEPVPVAAMPSALSPTIDVPTEIKAEEIVITQGDRRYRVRGLGKEHELRTVESERAGVRAANLRGESGFHVDTLDLYSARQRTVFIKQAAEELGVKEEVIRRDLGHVLLKLEELQDQQIKHALEPKPEEITLERGRASGRRWTCCAIRACSTASSATSSGAAWWARRPTSW